MRPDRSKARWAVALLLLAGAATAIAAEAQAGPPAPAPVPVRAAAPLPDPSPGVVHLQSPTRQSGMPARSIRLPALAVTGSIGVTRTVDGVLVPPRSATEVGVWPGSAPLDARTGETTIAGHVTWPRLGPMVFRRLAYLRPGDLVYTTDAAGAQTAWRVFRVYARAKDRPVDPAAFAGAAGPRRLVLITCGGAFDARTRSYAANVYVFARPTHQQP